jgi:RNase P subunit RPR2
MNKFCAPCNTIFPRQDDFFQHNETEHGIHPSSWKAPKTSGIFGGRNKTGDFVCATCDLEFTPDEFHQFHQIADQDTNMKKCKYCSRNFFNNNLLGKHYHADHAIPKRDRKLKNSPKSASNPTRQLTPQDFDMLTLITNIPSSGKSGTIPIYTCKACLNNYQSQDFIISHIAEVHKEDAFTRVLCKQCHISFKDARNLRLHNQVHHKPDSTRYICPICSTVTLLPKRHLKEKHPDAKITMADLKVISIFYFILFVFICIFYKIGSAFGSSGKEAIFLFRLFD